MFLKINMKGLNKFSNLIIMQNKSTSFIGPIGAMWKKIALFYLVYTRRRFLKNSGGGGEWPPLKRKRKRGKLSSAKILRDTGTLLNALTMGAKGNLANKIPNGIVVGFDQASHPGGVTIQQLASWHDSGAGRLPKRQILHQPDTATMSKINGAVKKALKELEGQSNF